MAKTRYVITEAPFMLHEEFGVFLDKSQANEMVRQLRKYDPRFRGRGLKVSVINEKTGKPKDWHMEHNPQSRFKKLEKKLAAKGVESPGGLAAWIGRRKYGVEGFAAMSRKGRKGNPANKYTIVDATIDKWSTRRTAKNEHADIIVIIENEHGKRYEYLFSRTNGYTLAKAKKEALMLASKGIFKNPSIATAESLSKAFHGREVLEVDEIQEAYRYPGALTKLGKLTQIEVSDGEYVTPIDFNKPQPDLCSNPEANQMYFIGGNQGLSREDLKEFGVEDTSKQYCVLGIAHTLSYTTDKHHLSDSDGKVAEYIHELGEESGDKPMVVYDGLNKRILLVGGSYKVEDRGIVN